MTALDERCDVSPAAGEATPKPRESVDQYPDRVFNFTVCLLDWIGASVGLAFLSITTLVPVFLKHLGASNLTIGLLPALLNLAFMLPGVMVARRISRMARVRPYIFRNAVIERVLLLPIGLLAPVLAITHPQWMIAITFVCVGGFGICVGMNQPPYWTIISKTIPVTWRGRMMGISGLITGILGLGAGWLINHLLSGPDGGFPNGFGKCFLIGAVIILISVINLGLIREPDGQPSSSLADEPHILERCAQIWRENPSFRRFLMAQAAVSFATMAGPFYVLYAHTSLHAPNNSIAIYTTTLMLGTAIGGLVFGLMADRAGNKVTYVSGVVCLLAATCATLLIHSPLTFAVVFIAAALADSACQIAASNLTLEMAPTSQDIPFYTAFAGIAVALPRLCAPLAGGLFSDHFGYRTTFIIAAAFAAASIAFTLRIREPRTIAEAHPHQPEMPI